ncbi:MAG: hypothetical protein AAF551_04825 [Bacteroidota bacterium]
MRIVGTAKNMEEDEESEKLVLETGGSIKDHIGHQAIFRELTGKGTENAIGFLIHNLEKYKKYKEAEGRQVTLDKLEEKLSLIEAELMVFASWSGKKRKRFRRRRRR